MNANISRLIKLLEKVSNNEKELKSDIEKLMEIEEIDIFYRRVIKDIYGGSYYLPRRLFREGDIFDRLNGIEEKIDALSKQNNSECRLSQKDVDSFPQFLTAVDHITVAMGQAKSRFVEHFQTWFEERERGVIVDPYIFAPGNGTESINDYCQGVIKIIGENVERIDIYYSPVHYDSSIAINIFNGVNNIKIRDFNFYPCTNIHDRVWMRHYELNDEPIAEKWEGRVVGSSINSIVSRPTYVIDMPQKDAENYSKILRNIRTGNEDKKYPVLGVTGSKIPPP